MSSYDIASDASILVVDDEPSVNGYLRDMLESMGYTVILAEDGVEALEKAATRDPDLVLLDVMMPNMDGFEVCRRLRRDPYMGDIPILMVTGLDDQESVLKGIEAGADNVMIKPFNAAHLQAHVRNVVRMNRYKRLLFEKERNLDLLNDLDRSHVKLALAYDATLEGWVRALDLRDNETEGHTKRVTELTVRLARKAGVAEDHLVHVKRGALLHDIGKIGIPDAILCKTGALEPAERETMEQHPVYAYEMLSHIEYLKPALNIPYCHHEHWDGSGYPRGLAGEEIPLTARVFSVVDVRDALLYDRRYRKGWPAEKVDAHIAELAGTHFDPRVVEAYLACGW